MAKAVTKALQCPDCGHRHPLADFASYRTFRCQECRRLLKVPRSVEPEPVRAPTEQPREQPRDDRGTKKVPPSQRGNAIAEQSRGERGEAPVGTVSRALRALVWVVAVPAGLVPVLGIGRLVGILTVDRAIDVFVGVGFMRFVVPLLVLPVWAALTATIAHFTIERLARPRAGGRSASGASRGS